MHFGLRSKIAINLLVLFCLASGVLFPLLVSGLQQMVLNSETQRAGSFVKMMALSGGINARDISMAPFPAWSSSIAAVMFMEDNAKTLYPEDCADDLRAQLLNIILKSSQSHEPIRLLAGSTWAVLWPQPKWLYYARPAILPGSQNTQIIAVALDLQPAYRQLRQFFLLTLPVAVLVALLFTVAGTAMISRFTLKPIQRLVRRAETHHGDSDPTLIFESKEGNEFTQLASALHIVFSDLKEKENHLQQSVQSLATANQQLKRAQREIVQAEKLSSVGRLASGIAHEIGNPIAIVMGYLELLRNEQLPLDEKADYLQRAEKEVSRIGKIVQELLDLSRPSDAVSQLVHLHALLDDVVHLLADQPATAQLHIETNYSAICDCVQADPGQIHQVFLNLLLNAADAIAEIPAGKGRTGTIKVSSANAGNDDALKSKWVCVTVEDSGIGVPQENLSTIFDPFFSTKEPGKGTGLGLSVSYMLVEKMGGRIHCESVDGKGSRFLVRLPVHHSSGSGSEMDAAPLEQD